MSLENRISVVEEAIIIMKICLSATMNVSKVTLTP
jgi:hypothetical protein